MLSLALSLLISAPYQPQDSLIVEYPQITSIAYDQKEKGTRINLMFSVRDSKGAPVNNLKPGRNGNFRVFLDNIEETSFETLTNATITAPPVGITLVLDTSYSMEDQNALKSMKKAAENFVSRLQANSNVYHFTYYKFATDVAKIGSLKEIDTTKAFGRFTSLYSAMKIAIEDNPKNIVLLFTDGADNKSIDNEQKRVAAIQDLEQVINEHKTIVHTVKLGVEDSNDMQGVPNKEVLKRISKNGSLRYSQNPEQIIRAFEEVAAGMAHPYIFSYLCPRTSEGNYTLGIEIDRQGVASNRANWKKEVRFDLPFTIAKDNSIAPLADKRLIQALTTKYVCLYPTKENPDQMIPKLFDPFSNSVSDIEFANSSKLSLTFAAYNFKDVENAKYLNFNIRVSGPVEVINKFIEEQKKRPSLKIQIFRYSVYENGMRWMGTEEIAVPVTDKFVVKANDNVSYIGFTANEVKLPMKIVPAIRSFVFLTGSYVDELKQLKYFDISQASVAEVKE